MRKHQRTTLLLLTGILLTGCGMDWTNEDEHRTELERRGFENATTVNGSDWDVQIGECRAHLTVGIGHIFSYRSADGATIKDVTAFKLLQLPEFSGCDGGM